MIGDFYRGGQDHEHQKPTVIEADHPGGRRHRPDARGASAQRAGRLSDERPGQHCRGRGIDLESVDATVEGDINLLGILGLDDSVRNGFEGIRVVFRKGGCRGRKAREARHVDVQVIPWSEVLAFT
jgi:hypothetical protein